MKKTTKSLWIYVGVLFVIALALIILTTTMQYKVIDDGGKFNISSSFTKNAKENIEGLTNQNIELGKQIDELTAASEENKQKLAEDEALIEQMNSERDTASKLYSAYKAGDTDLMKTMIATVKKDTLEQYIPGLYDYVTKAIAD